MKKVTIIGIGTCRDTVTLEGLKAIENADIIIGGQRNIDWFTYLKKPSIPQWEAVKIKEIIDGETATNFAVLMSGDVGFYSGAKRLVETLKDCEVTLLPGVSTVQVFFAKLKLPWQEAKLISMHGGNRDIVDAVRNNYYTFCLTSKDKAKIAEKLIANGFSDIKVYVGDNLGADDERIFSTAVRELNAQLNSESRTVFLFENDTYNGKIQ